MNVFQVVVVTACFGDSRSQTPGTHVLLSLTHCYLTTLQHVALASLQPAACSLSIIIIRVSDFADQYYSTYST